MSKRLAKLIEIGKQDTNEARKALRLQAEAWRIIAIIACHDQALGKRLAHNLIMVSFPFVNGGEVEKLISEYRPVAEDHGKQCGIFAKDKP